MAALGSSLLEPEFTRLIRNASNANFRCCFTTCVAFLRTILTVKNLQFENFFEYFRCLTLAFITEGYDGHPHHRDVVSQTDVGLAVHIFAQNG
jgi:hypothetical protein